MTIYKNIGLLALSSALGRVIGIAAMPIIARMYSPSDFGALSTFTAITNLLIPLATLRYANAISLPRTRAGAMGMFLISASFIGIFSVLCAMLLIILGPFIFEKIKSTSLLPYWPLIPAAVAMGAIYEAYSFLITRDRQYKLLARSQIFQSIIGSGVKVIFGYFNIHPAGLLIGQAFQQGGGITGFTMMYRRQIVSGLKKLSLKRLFLLLRIYVEMPLYRLPANVLFVAAAQTPILFFAQKYSQEEVGQLGLALSTLSVPISLIARSTSNVYYGEIARLGRKRIAEISEITKELIKKLFLVSLLPTFILFFFSPIIFSIIFGKKWELSGQFSSLLSLSLLTQFVANPIIGILNILRKELVALRIHAARLLIIVISFGLASAFSLTAVECIGVYSCALAIHYAITIFGIMKILESEMKKNE